MLEKKAKNIFERGILRTVIRSKGFSRTIRTAAIFMVAFFFWWRIQSLSPSMPDNDPYYHIKVASLISENGPLEHFPWTRFSVWGDRFFDKDLLFHLLLVPFAGEDLFS